MDAEEESFAKSVAEEGAQKAKEHGYNATPMTRESFEGTALGHPRDCGRHLGAVDRVRPAGPRRPPQRAARKRLPHPGIAHPTADSDRAGGSRRRRVGAPCATGSSDESSDGTPQPSDEPTFGHLSSHGLHRCPFVAGRRRRSGDEAESRPSAEGTRTATAEEAEEAEEAEVEEAAARNSAAAQADQPSTTQPRHKRASQPPARQPPHKRASRRQPPGGQSNAG